MKSLNRSTPLVRISKSSGGQSAVNKWSVMVCAVIDSMSISPEVTVLVDELDVEMEESLAEGEGVEFRGIVEEETISRIAVVISSREVYGKQTFNIALPSFLLDSTKRERRDVEITFYYVLSFLLLARSPPKHPAVIGISGLALSN